ncbi:KR domain-containing protein, partial [Mycena polygramma]
LFRHDKSYILLGGIGGLGIDLAVWMYQVPVSKIAYLRSCDQLELQLVKCDATDTGATSRLVESIRLPIGGCFQLTLVLSDRLFLNQTRETFAAPQTAKLTVFETFAAVAEIENLDFYVAFSSFSGLVGYVGQSNYASACTVLEGVLSRYSNAFSLVVPGIQDAGYLVGLSSRGQLWICLEDGLRKLRDGQSFTRYIPDLDWDSWHARYPLSPTFRHLLSSAQQKIESKVEDLMGEEDILRIVLSAMEVEEQDFDSERPLLSYGLDSLSATRLSAELNPFVQVSQIQLLAGVSWSELRDSLLQTQKAEPDPETAAAVQLRPTDHDNSTVLAAETIVEICIGPGLPLIVFPGATGRLGPLLALRTHFSGALWGVQVTESTPVAPFMTHAAFVVQKIREKQPNGPYRLGAFSGAGVLGVAVAKLLEESGQEVIQLAFIDGFPLLWTEEETELFLREQELPALLNRAIISIIDLLRHDPIYGPDSEQILQWEAALAGTPDATETHLATIAATRRLAPPLLRFLLGFYPTSAQRSYAAFADALACWVSSLKAPFSVFIAEFGMLATMPDVSRRVWADLGAHR